MSIEKGIINMSSNKRVINDFLLLYQHEMRVSGEQLTQTNDNEEQIALEIERSGTRDKIELLQRLLQNENIEDIENELLLIIDLTFACLSVGNYSEEQQEKILARIHKVSNQIQTISELRDPNEVIAVQKLIQKKYLKIT